VVKTDMGSGTSAPSAKEPLLLSMDPPPPPVPREVPRDAPCESAGLRGEDKDGLNADVSRPYISTWNTGLPLNRCTAGTAGKGKQTFYFPTTLLDTICSMTKHVSHGESAGTRVESVFHTQHLRISERMVTCMSCGRSRVHKTGHMMCFSCFEVWCAPHRDEVVFIHQRFEPLPHLPLVLLPLRLRLAPARARPQLQGRNLESKAKLKSSLSYFNFKLCETRRFQHEFQLARPREPGRSLLPPYTHGLVSLREFCGLGFRV